MTPSESGFTRCEAILSRSLCASGVERCGYRPCGWTTDLEGHKRAVCDFHRRTTRFVEREVPHD